MEVIGRGATELQEVLRPKSGEMVNTHVVAPASIPRPDFAAMRQILEGGRNEGGEGFDRPKREERTRK